VATLKLIKLRRLSEDGVISKLIKASFFFLSELLIVSLFLIERSALIPIETNYDPVVTQTDQVDPTGLPIAPANVAEPSDPGLPNLRYA
jgi:hypothetical protein